MGFLKSVPAVPLFTHFLGHRSEHFKRGFYQCWMFVLTFVVYMIYHMVRRPFPLAKAVLSSRNCQVNNTNTTNNNNIIINKNNNIKNNTDCTSWAPFDGSQNDLWLFGLLDFTFQLAYSVFMFVNGYIAERTDLRIFLTCAMLLTSASVSLFGFIRVFEVHRLGVFFLLQLVSGIASSTGLPIATEVLGNWITVDNSGLVFGLWTVNNFAGNILGNVLSGPLLDGNWELAFLIPAAIMAAISLLVFLTLVPHPSMVNVQLVNKSKNKRISTINVNNNSKNDKSNDAISFWAAIHLSGVIEFAMCSFFAKMVTYTFFYWLPYMFELIFDKSTGFYYSSFFDVGCGIGGIITGFLYDFVGSPAIICVVFLVSAAPTIFLMFAVAGNVAWQVGLIFELFSFFFVGISYFIQKNVGEKISGQLEVI